MDVIEGGENSELSMPYENFALKTETIEDLSDNGDGNEDYNVLNIKIEPDSEEEVELSGIRPKRTRSCAVRNATKNAPTKKKIKKKTQKETKRQKSVKKKSKKKITEEDIDIIEIVATKKKVLSVSKKKCCQKKNSVDENNRDHRCKVCQKVYSSLRKLGQHQRVHTNKLPFQCQECKKCFKYQSSLYIHTVKHVDVKPLPCKVCNKAFSDRFKLKIHEKRHLGLKPFVCDVCGSRFTEAGSLKRHILIHTGQKNFNCSYCGKSHYTKGAMLKHQEIHEPRRRSFKCEECGNGFYSKLLLSIHMVRHSEDRPLHCDYCGKNFAQRGSLRGHMLQHTGEKPHKCEICGKLFRQKRSLNQHMDAHLGIMKYECEICGRRFVRPVSLWRHRIVHTGDKPFACKICGLAFADPSALSRHIVKHNPSYQDNINSTAMNVTESQTVENTVENIVEPVAKKSKRCNRTTFNRKRRTRKAKRSQNTEQNITAVAAEITSTEPIAETQDLPMEYTTELLIRDIIEGVLQKSVEYTTEVSFKDITEISEADKDNTRTSVRRSGRQVVVNPIPQIKKLMCVHCGIPFNSKRGLSCHVRVHDVPNKTKAAEINNTEPIAEESDCPVEYTTELLIKEIIEEIFQKSVDNTRRSGRRRIGRQVVADSVPQIQKLECVYCGIFLNSKRGLSRHVHVHDVILNKGNLGKRKIPSPPGEGTVRPLPEVMQRQWVIPTPQKSTLANIAQCNTPSQTKSIVEFTKKVGSCTLRTVDRNECTVCGRVLPSPSMLQRHLLTHPQKDLHTCTLCNLQVVGKTSFRDHLLTHFTVPQES